MSRFASSMIQLALLFATVVAREEREEARGELRIETFSWQGKRLHKSLQIQKEDDDDVPRMPSQEEGAARRLDERRMGLEALWDRPSYRMRRFNFTVEPGEHACFAGFHSMMRDTNRCNGWQRTYPAKGSNQSFYNTGANRMSNFTLQDVVAGHINVWVEERRSTDVHRDVAVKAAEIYTNDKGAEELKPTQDTHSWMEQECKVMGQMPFMYSCSNRINVLVQRCGFDNAFVMSSDFLVNYPAPVNNKSGPNNDIIFYLCHELVDGNPNPYAVANTFAHELAHVIQGGFGSSSGVMMEGGATWLEGNLLNLAPRPMIYAWGFRDWNRINAAHIYAQTKRANARKFYQIHAMLLTYLSQETLLGDAGSSALQSYETFTEDLAPFGRRTYDYFLQYVGKDRPGSFRPSHLEVDSVEHPFGEVLLNFRVALASQCISDAQKRPTEARYLMPENLRERPFWDCTSFPTFSQTGAASHEGLDLHYGGAGIYRLAFVGDATVQLDRDADWQIRTKVLASGTGTAPAEVRELRPGEHVSFVGEREIFIVQVNVDPEGETLSRDDKGSVWRQDDCDKLLPGCTGKAWTTSKNGFYPSLAAEGLRTPMLSLPEAQNLSFNFNAWWRMEAVEGGFMSKTENGCELDGWDGAQVRLHVYKDPTAAEHAHGDEVIVLEPQGGYDNRTQDAIAALANGGIRAPYSKAYAKDCKSLDGWTGSSPHPGFAQQNFSLEKYAGRHVRIEVVFASDSGTVMTGFWLKDFMVHHAGQVLFKEMEDLYTSAFIHSIPAGTVGSAGVPVVVQYPEGYEADTGLSKRWITRRGAWSAQWAGRLRRQYLGWSYESAVEDTKTMKLRPGQEACLQLRTPFRGVLSEATLFTLVDKVGIRSVTLQGRDAAMRPLGKATSVSPGVTDPGVHRFLLEQWPIMEEQQLFFLCVSTGDVQHLLTDTSDSSPFLHLPLTNVAAATRDEPGWMVLREDGQEVPADELGNLWLEHRITLRAEFVEVPRSQRLRR